MVDMEKDLINGRSCGVGMSDCIRNLICCFFCYEFFCTDLDMYCVSNIVYFSMVKVDLWGGGNNEENYNEMV